MIPGTAYMSDGKLRIFSGVLLGTLFFLMNALFLESKGSLEFKYSGKGHVS
jgi:hypothetical protein